MDQVDEDRVEDQAEEGRLKGGLTWEKLADGRVWRLKQGKHFSGTVDDFREDVNEAARSLARPVLTLRDPFGKWQYLWLQFLDAVIRAGQPCRFCDSTEFERHRESVAQCAGCGAMLLLQKQAPPGIRSNWRKDLTQFTDVKLRLIDRRSDVDRYAGHGIAPDGRMRLLYVDYLVDRHGRRLRGPEGELLYNLGSFVADGFENAIAFESFTEEVYLVEGDERELAIDEREDDE